MLLRVLPSLPLAFVPALLTAQTAAPTGAAAPSHDARGVPGRRDVLLPTPDAHRAGPAGPVREGPVPGGPGHGAGAAVRRQHPRRARGEGQVRRRPGA